MSPQKFLSYVDIAYLMGSDRKQIEPFFPLHELYFHSVSIFESAGRARRSIISSSNLYVEHWQIFLMHNRPIWKLQSKGKEQGSPKLAQDRLLSDSAEIVVRIAMNTRHNLISKRDIATKRIGRLLPFSLSVKPFIHVH